MVFDALNRCYVLPRSIKSQALSKHLPLSLKAGTMHIIGRTHYQSIALNALIQAFPTLLSLTFLPSYPTSLCLPKSESELAACGCL